VIGRKMTDERDKQRGCMFKVKVCQGRKIVEDEKGDKLPANILNIEKSKARAILTWCLDGRNFRGTVRRTGVADCPPAALF